LVSEIKKLILDADDVVDTLIMLKRKDVLPVDLAHQRKLGDIRGKTKNIIKLGLFNFTFLMYMILRQ